MADQAVHAHFEGARADCSRATSDGVGRSKCDEDELADRDGDGAMLGRLLIYAAVVIASAAMLWTRVW
jgi:hypothetical protein